MPRQTEADYRLSPFYQFALRTKLWRHFKTARGIVRTYFKGANQAYDHPSYWDAYYRTARVEDSTTIDHGKDALSTKVHYNAVESIILSALDRDSVAIEGTSVLDIGSGAGHWLTFYRSMGAARVVGVEVSAPAAGDLINRFRQDDAIEIMNTTADQIDFRGVFDIVNAIGVMFHIVDDQAFERSVAALKAAVKPGGCLVVGGQFGMLDNLNVQFDREGRVTKRLRSYRHWRRSLGPGWKTRRIVNRAYRLVNATLPEANILFARKRGR